MRPRNLITVATIAALTVSTVVIARASAPLALDSRQSRSDDCPVNAPRLHDDGIVRATEQALEVAPDLYGKKATKDGVRVRRAAVASWAGPRGKTIQNDCGRKAMNRTVIVDLFFIAHKDSASLSQGVVAVSRHEVGYVVWRTIR
jgi:hypothetical protein